MWLRLMVLVNALFYVVVFQGDKISGSSNHSHDQSDVSGHVQHYMQ